uniref:ENTH domain-containing protein n=1 Tax=Mesocestoides corti TaxID=53468 RepID=A0A5K3F015_MESCO
MEMRFEITYLLFCKKVSQYMASNNCSFHLPHFNDKSSSQSEKTKSYQLMAFDFCKVKRGKDDGVMRTMPANKLLKALPVLRDQLNVLFEFEATEKDLNNLIINAAFILLYKDLIRLFASYNEGMMNLVEKFFSMKRSHCRTALELYRDFPNIMTKVDEFLTVAERLGIGDKEAMGLHPVPPQILEAMEQHLALLNKTKKPGDDDHDDADGKEEEDVGKNSTKKPLSTAKIAASPARPKSPSKHVSASPSRPTSSPAGEAKATPSEALLIADLNTLPVDEDNSSGNLPSNHIKAPPTEVIVTNPDGESTEPVEDDGVCQQVIEAEEEEEESEENEKDEADEAEGLSAEQQQAVIAAAAQHFAHSSELTNQAVKQSVMLTPRQTRKTQHETGGADRSPSSTRSRSPSPVRPPPPRSPSPVRPASPRSGRSTPLHETPDSDNVLSAEESNVGQTREAEDATEDQCKPQPRQANSTADVDIDDLLGFGDEVPVSQVKPTVQAMSAPLQATQPPAVQSKPHSALDDLLSLDPLMDGGSNSTPLTGTATPSTKFDPSGLPAGLKPAPTDVLIRPAVVDKGAAKNANPLDQLDTTLASLASSLGSRTSDWGSASAKNK